MRDFGRPMVLISAASVPGWREWKVVVTEEWMAAHPRTWRMWLAWEVVRFALHVARGGR